MEHLIEFVKFQRAITRRVLVRFRFCLRIREENNEIYHLEFFFFFKMAEKCKRCNENGVFWFFVNK